MYAAFGDTVVDIVGKNITVRFVVRPLTTEILNPTADRSICIHEH
jgi:hypothetical protein